MSRVLARIAGAFEHPQRDIPDKSIQTVYQEIFAGALADAGMTADAIDGLYASHPPGGVVALADQLGLTNLRHLNSTDYGGSTYVGMLGDAARMIQAGQASAVLVIMAGIPRNAGRSPRVLSDLANYAENAHGSTLISQYAQVASRHMALYGTTREDLAHIKVTSAYHASFNPNAFLQKRVTVEEVLEQPPMAWPLHRMDCCVTTDGGGAYIVVSEEIAKSLGTNCPGILAQEVTTRNWANGAVDLMTTGASITGPRALAAAGLTHSDIDFASIYDSFTITVLKTIEDLGFAEPGKGAALVKDGGLQAPFGKLPTNTDGGGLSNNHPDFRGGMVRAIEAVRQLRGQAHPELQVKDCEFALVHGTGYSLGHRHASATAILSRGDI